MSESIEQVPMCMCKALVAEAQNLSRRLSYVDAKFAEASAVLGSCSCSCSFSSLAETEADAFRANVAHRYAMDRRVIEEAQVFVDGLLSRAVSTEPCCCCCGSLLLSFEEHADAIESVFSDELSWLSFLVIPGAVADLFSLPHDRWEKHVFDLIGHSDAASRARGCALLSVCDLSESFPVNDVFLEACRSGHTDVVTEFLRHARVLVQADDTTAEAVAEASCHVGLCLMTSSKKYSRFITDLFTACRSTLGLGNGYRRLNPSEKDNAAIQAAAAKGHAGVVEALLKFDIRINPSANYNYAIRAAACEGHADVVTALLSDERVDPTANRSFAMFSAAGNGHVDVVGVLLKCTHIDPTFDQNRALISATIRGHPLVVQALLEDCRVRATVDYKTLIGVSATRLGEATKKSDVVRHNAVIDILRRQQSSVCDQATTVF